MKKNITTLATMDATTVDDNPEPELIDSLEMLSLELVGDKEAIIEGTFAEEGTKEGEGGVGVGD